MPEPKIVITGTGRAGTTLLVNVLTRLGLDTGEGSPNVSGVDTRTHGGLESLLDAPDAPCIVKDTTLPFRLGKLLEAGTVSVSHVIVPIRNLDLAAASRVRASNYGKNIFARGGLWGTVDPVKQRDALASMLYELMYTIAKFELPHTLLEFPRFTTDWQYTHRALSFLAPEQTPEAFRDVLAAAVQTDLIHEEPLRTRERLRVRRRAVQLKMSAHKGQPEV
ncbi:MAG: hypothetical protein ACLPVY_21405 [Acidimicrobiia bacterium]